MIPNAEDLFATRLQPVPLVALQIITLLSNAMFALNISLAGTSSILMIAAGNTNISAKIAILSITLARMRNNMFMFRSIAKRRKDDEKAKNIVLFDDDKFVSELHDFVKSAFAELPETETYEEDIEEEG